MPFAPPPDGRNGGRRPRTFADLVVATLRASGVRRIYGLPGDSLNALTEALRRDGELAWEHVRHEESAALAAGGEAAMTDELAVCAASCGPGSVHLINGLLDANRSGVPILGIAAQIPRGDRQRLLPGDPSRRTVPRVQRVQRAGERRRAAPAGARDGGAPRRRAPGVAVVVVPGEILGARTDGAHRPHAIRGTVSLIRPDDATLLAAADVLNAAERVTILAGAGCRAAHSEVVALAERLEAPIVHSLRGKEWVEYDNPYSRLV